MNKKIKTKSVKDYRFAIRKVLEDATAELNTLNNLANPDVAFDEENHRYINRRTGEPYAGVSEIISLKTKSFMAPWAALETARYLGWENEERTKEILEGKWTYQQWQDLLKEAKASHRQISQDAQTSGSITHEWIEKSIWAEMNEEELPEIPEDNTEAYNAIHAYLKWRKNQDIIWHASELVVASDLYRFAGTLDALATINGRLTLMDFKSSKNFYPEMELQLGAYLLALEEMQVFPQDAIILRLPKDGTDAIVKPMTIPYDLCRRTFLALREVKKWESYVANHN